MNTNKKQINNKNENNIYKFKIKFKMKSIKHIYKV